MEARVGAIEIGRAALVALALVALGCSEPSTGVIAGAEGGMPMSQTTADEHGARVDRTPRILVMTAMRSEIQPLLAATTVTREVAIGGRTHYVGQLGDTDVVIVAGGVSMLNGALSALEAIHHFDVTGIVFSGIAGGANPGLGIGHVTVPGRWAEYQEQWFTDDPEEIAERELGGFGMMYPGPVRVARHGGAADATDAILWFPVDEALLAAARRAAATDLTLERCNRDGHCVEQAPGIEIGGGGVSGPTYVNHGEYRDWVWATFRPHVLDMETAAVAQVAYANDVPYIAVRGISDLAGGHDERNRMTTFTPMAARNAAALTIALLHELPGP